jgi:desulfoferrodoxin-like iron-binding protein
MADFDNAVEEINEGVDQEVQSIQDIDSASDFELKHTPNIQVEELASGQLIKVSIGLKGIKHPQQEDHFIEFIRVFDNEELIGEANFGPNDTPYIEVETKRNSDEIIAQANCNLHGLWEARV